MEVSFLDLGRIQNKGQSMIDRINVKKIVNGIEKADTLAAIISLLHSQTDAEEIKIVAYHCFPPMGADNSDPISLISCQEYSKEQIRAYKKSRLYRGNPFVMKPLLLARPLFWSEIIKLPDHTDKDMCFIKEFKDRFDGDGISIPVFGPFGHNGSVAVRLGSQAETISNFDILNLQMLCQQGHLHICNLLEKRDKRRVSFTKRERDILEWVAMGKSNSVIADILGISTHTVNGYLRQLSLKLNTTNRVSTAFRAIALGAIY